LRQDSLPLSCTTLIRSELASGSYVFVAVESSNYIISSEATPLDI